MGCAESSDLGSPTIRCRMRLRFFKTKLLMIDQDYWETASPSQGFDEKRISRKRGSARLPGVQACPRCGCALSTDAEIRSHRSMCCRRRWLQKRLQCPKIKRPEFSSGLANLFVLNLVRRGGLEPPRCYPLTPQASAFANSAISVPRPSARTPDSCAGVARDAGMIQPGGCL